MRAPQKHRYLYMVVLMMMCDLPAMVMLMMMHMLMQYLYLVILYLVVLMHSGGTCTMILHCSYCWGPRKPRPAKMRGHNLPAMVLSSVLIQIMEVVVEMMMS